MTKDEIKKIIRKYAKESLKEVVLEIEEPPKFIDPELDAEFVFTNFVNTEGPSDILSMRSGDMSLSMSVNGLGMLTLSNPLTLMSLFDEIVAVHNGGIKIPLNNINTINEFHVYDDLFFSEELSFAMNLGNLQNEEYKEQLRNCLLCEYNDLILYMTDEQPGVRQLAERRWNWKIKLSN